MLIVVEHFHASDLGRQRQGNEDSYFVRAPLFVVADGMGGAQAGEVASEMAVESFDGGLPDGSPSGSPRSNEETAISDATSPACAPPMPSATTKIGARTKKESSLAFRWRPVSVR